MTTKPTTACARCAELIRLAEADTHWAATLSRWAEEYTAKGDTRQASEATRLSEVSTYWAKYHTQQAKECKHETAEGGETP